ncbi:MAG: Hsp20/alpha crystallin family protein [Betaproteobacteria bacterium]|nr:Hsp20/alpha crystallin family protein [Betaproteobacteria bacterium]
MNTLVRLNPNTFPDRLDDLFAGFFRPINQEGRGVEAIKIDVSEDEKAYKVTAVLPGVKKEDIHVAVDKNEVSISTEIKRETTAKEGERVIHTERYYGKASRVFSVSQDIDEAQVAAKYTDGVLALTLPKKTQAAAKRVAIE